MNINGIPILHIYLEHVSDVISHPPDRDVAAAYVPAMDVSDDIDILRQVNNTNSDGAFYESASATENDPLQRVPLVGLSVSPPETEVHNKGSGSRIDRTS